MKRYQISITVEIESDNIEAVEDIEQDLKGAVNTVLENKVGLMGHVVESDFDEV